MTKKYLLILLLLNLQPMLSQDEDVDQFDDQAYFITVSTEKLNLSPSKEEEIPLFLVDEGLVLDSCQKESSYEKSKHCTINTLEKILRKKLNSRIHKLFHKESKIFITTSIFIDTTGTITYKDIAITLKGLKTHKHKELLLVKEVKKIISKFPKVTPAKNNEIVHTVTAHLSSEFRTLK